MALTDNLYDWVPCIDASGNSVGVKGSLTLTAVNSPTSQAATNVYPTQRLFNGSNQSMTAADAAAISGGASVSRTIAFGFKATTLSGTVGLWTKDDFASGSTREINTYYNGSRIVAEAWNAAGTIATATANTFGAVSTGVDIFVVTVYNASSQLLSVSVNGGAFDSASLSDNRDTATVLRIGGFTSGGAGSNFFTGAIGPFGYWQRAFTQQECADLYAQKIPFRGPYHFARRMRAA